MEGEAGGGLSLGTIQYTTACPREVQGTVLSPQLGQGGPLSTQGSYWVWRFWLLPPPLPPPLPSSLSC